jgi:hypothetical protein
LRNGDCSEFKGRPICDVNHVCIAECYHDHECLKGDYKYCDQEKGLCTQCKAHNTGCNEFEKCSPDGRCIPECKEDYDCQSNNLPNCKTGNIPLYGRLWEQVRGVLLIIALRAKIRYKRMRLHEL